MAHIRLNISYITMNYICLYIYIHIYIYIYKTVQHISGQWEKMALDRSQWCKLIIVGIESFENSCVQYAPCKQSICKGKQGPAPGPPSHHINCEMCGKLSHLLVLKSICTNMSNLLLFIMTFMWAKVTDNAQSVVKFAAIRLAWKVICRYIQPNILICWFMQKYTYICWIHTDAMN